MKANPEEFPTTFAREYARKLNATGESHEKTLFTCWLPSAFYFMLLASGEVQGHVGSGRISWTTA